MLLPRQNISEKDKNRDWLKENIDAIRNSFNHYYSRRVKDYLVYNILQGNLSEKKFEYITKEFGKEYPVKLKNYPLIRPVLQVALGEETEQIYNYHIRRIDEDGLLYKEYKVHIELMKFLYNEFEKALAGAKQMEVLDERKLRQLKENIGRDYLMEVEILCEKLLKYFELSLDFKGIRTALFASILEVGKCFWKYEEGNYKSKIGIRVIPSYNLVYSNEEGIENIADSNWICERLYLTREQILDRYQDYLTDEDKEKLDRQSNYYLTNEYYHFVEMVKSYYQDLGYNPNYYLQDTQDKMEVYIGQWKSISKRILAEIEGKYGVNYVKLLTEKDNVNRKTIKSKESRYMQELYEFVCIGSDIYVWDKIGKSNIQMRSFSNPYYVKLHYGGLEFKIDSTGEEFSLVYYLKDLQELYNILNYHRERMIALSGVKGVIYDISQLPKGLELHDLLYYRKLGLLIIDSSLGQGQFNQFQSYNDSLDASISVITQMLEDIRNEVDRISGFNRQRQGQMFQKDLVGQIDRAIRQGSYATAVLYYFQSKVFREVLEGFLNYAKHYYYIHNVNTPLTYVLGDGKQEIFKLSQDFLLADYGIFMTDNVKENRYFEELKGMLGNMMQNQMMKASDVIRLLKVDSINELESKILSKIEEAEKQMEAMKQQQANQPDKEMEMKMKEMEIKLQIEQMKLKEMKEIKMLELEIARNENLQKAQLEKEKNEIDKKYKQEILKLKQELLNLERKEYENAVVLEQKSKETTRRKEIKNVL